MPDVSLLVDFNRFILAFWMSERGAVDNAQMWEWMDADSRQKVSLAVRAWIFIILISGPRLVPFRRYRFDGFCFRLDRLACIQWC
jgi:hypothetical protein